MGAIAAALQACAMRIETACAASGRDAHCARLLAVSKTFPANAIREAHAAGQSAFGESYVQEALPKITTLADLPLEWHFIGPLQSNKTRAVAEHFHWMHSLETEKIARRLSEQRPPHLPALNVCIQVNVSGEASKHGVAPVHAVDMARALAVMPGLCLRGFMAIPEATPDPTAQRARFRLLAELFDQARALGLPLDTLSMGMSADLEAAVLEGATMVRVGMAIFGARDHGKERTA